MASKKKKSRGKGKKASKMFGGKEKGQQQGTLDAQMDRLNIDEDSQTNAEEEALLEEAIKLAAAEKEALDAAATEREEDQMVKYSNGCHHGYVKTEDDVIAFAGTFIAAFVRVGLGESFGENLGAASEAVVKKYPEMWYDPSKLKQVVSLIVFNGTQEVLKGGLRRAQFLAAIACYFEDVAALYSGEKDKPDCMAKFSELFQTDEHTLVKYLRQKIPCSCLDEKYEEVKSITKMGVCFNSQCNLPEVERSKMLSCARCRGTNYCSRECQKADWRQHKSTCAKLVDWNAFGN